MCIVATILDGTVLDHCMSFLLLHLKNYYKISGLNNTILFSYSSVG